MDDQAYSRPKIAKEFGINEKTLSWLERTGRITIDWKTRNGLMVGELSEETKKVLACSKVALTAIKLPADLTLFPFHRFLHLRFLQIPVDDLYQELQDRNLVNPNIFTLDLLNKYWDAFVCSLPPSLQEKIKSGQSISSDDDKFLLATVLDISEVSTAYQHPELEQAFKFMTESPVKDCLDCALSTKSTLLDVQSFMKDIASFPITIEGLAFYQSVFHDISLVAPDNFKKYLKTIKPSIRGKMSLAVNSDINEFKLKSGYEREFETEQVLSVFKSALTDDLIRLLNTRTPDSERAFHYTLRSLLMVVDRLERSGIRGRRVVDVKTTQENDLLKSIQIESQEMNRMGIFRTISDSSSNANLT